MRNTSSTLAATTASDTAAAPVRTSRVRLPSGVQLEYAEQGPKGGTTLLLLHGITDSWRSFEPGLLDTAVSESLRAPAHVWCEAFAQLLADDFSAELRRIVASTLLVQGAADAFVPTADTERLLQQLPHARASVWAGAGHAMHWEEPARFAEELVRFVSALDD